MRRYNIPISDLRKLVATVGIRDLIVVETPDAILICAKDRADDVKRLVQKLVEEGYWKGTKPKE